MKEQLEMLATNGLGSYSLNPVHLEPFRKYHGLMTIATQPPVNRIHTLSDLAIQIQGEDGQWQNLCVDAYRGQAYPYPSETWRDKRWGLLIQRQRAFKHKDQLLVLEYSFESDRDQTIRLAPLFNIRDHHDTAPVRAQDYAFGIDPSLKVLKVVHPLIQLQVYGNLPFVMAVEERWLEDNLDGQPLRYAIETERGYPDLENHLQAGYYTLEISAHQRAVATFAIAYQSPFEFSEEAVAQVFADERARLEDLKSRVAWMPEAFVPLAYAADQFIAQRHTTGKASILAGYPWFTDWGRDTMISIPGLCIATGRAPLALEMIETFLNHRMGGIIPNNFPDQGEAPMYNTVDGTLWLFQGLYAYYQATKDQEGIERLYPILLEIMDAHKKGTINKIYVDADGLLCSGDPTTQLTWMDVKVEGWVVTPRHDKAVEINALYYNALKIMALFSGLLGKTDCAQAFDAQGDKLRTAFHKVFWNDANQYLNDLYMDGKAHAMVRPNMLFAISLPFPVLEPQHWESVVEVCRDHLYFPYGLRSLSPTDPEYCGLYQGNLLERDGAYHRGTGWGWLLGPFLEAHLKTYKDVEWVKEALKKALTHLEEGAIGTFAENFDGNAPHKSRGCCAQAWSVAELIRICALCYGTKA